jgi:hypothetical protein
LQLAHSIAVFKQKLKWRQIVMHGHAIVWFIWTFIASYGAFRSHGWITPFVLCQLSIVIAVRLSREETT